MDKKELLERRDRFVKRALEEWEQDVKPTGKAWWGDLRNDWKLHIITVALAFLLVWLLWPSKSHAAPVPGQSVITGSVYAMSISVCIDKKDAIAVLDAEKTLGHDHAAKLFDAIDKCDNVPMQFRVGPVVHTITNAAGKTYRVVEVTAPEDDKQKLYWMTSWTVLASVTKPGVRNNAIQQPIDARGA